MTAPHTSKDRPGPLYVRRRKKRRRGTRRQIRYATRRLKKLVSRNRKEVIGILSALLIIYISIMFLKFNRQHPKRNFIPGTQVPAKTASTQ